MTPRVRSLFAAAALLAAGAAPALADAKVCTGRNLLAGLKASDPASYAEMRAAADATPNGKNVLWKIEDPENPDHAPSFLFGTLHLTDDRVATLPPAAEAAFSDAMRVAIEIEDLSPTRVSEALQTLTARGAVLAKAGELSGLLSPDETTRASALLNRTGFDPAALNRVRPWVTLTVLGTPECERGRMIAGHQIVDGSIAERAENRGMGTFGLDTLELQLMSMAAIPDKTQAALLKSYLADPARTDDVVETAVQLYLARDIGAIWPLQAALARKSGVPAEALDAVEQSLLTERNERMFGRLSMHLGRGGLFVAVGAIHLPGKMGLVELVRQSGFTVTPVE